MVQRDSRGEGEQTEWRGGSGVALNSRPVAHGGRGARVATATAREARREGVRLSTAFVGVVQVGEEKRARSEARACEHAHSSSRAAGARAKGGSRREKEEGASSVSCCGRRGASTGARGRLEVVGSAVSAVGSTLTCSRARKWPAPAAFPRVLARPLVSSGCSGE